MSLFRTASHHLLAFSATMLMFTAALAADPRLQDFPLAIICEREGAIQISYLDEVSEEGVALYLTLDTNRAQKIDGSQGTVEPLSGNLPLSCFGKTIEQLRDENSVIEMPD